MIAPPPPSVTWLSEVTGDQSSRRLQIAVFKSLFLQSLFLQSPFLQSPFLHNGDGHLFPRHLDERDIRVLLGTLEHDPPAVS